MAYMSATEIISQLSNTNKLPDFQKQNGLIYRQTKYAYQRRLSPWYAKKKQVKNNKNPRNNQEDKSLQPGRTQQFLRKIFPYKPKQSIVQSPSTQLKQTKYKSCQKTIEQPKESQQNPIIFFPIKDLALKKVRTGIQFSSKLKSKAQRRSKSLLRTVQPQMKFKSTQHYSQRLNQTPKMPPMVQTFRKSWRKKQKCKTQVFEEQQIGIRKRLSIEQVYNLIGRKPIQYMEQRPYNQFQQKNHDNSQKVKTQWLIPRSMKNKKTRRMKSYVYKTYNF